MYLEEPLSLLRLRVVADADLLAVICVVQRFHNLNIVPRRISAEFGTDHRLHIEVDVIGLPKQQLGLVADKIGQAPSIHHTHWYLL